MLNRKHTIWWGGGGGGAHGVGVGVQVGGAVEVQVAAAGGLVREAGAALGGVVEGAEHHLGVRVGLPSRLRAYFCPQLLSACSYVEKWSAFGIWGGVCR